MRFVGAIISAFTAVVVILLIAFLLVLEAARWLGCLWAGAPGVSDFIGSIILLGLVAVIVRAGIFIVRQHVLYRHDRKMLEDGCCLQCGYDLRGSQERCPECGTRVLARQAKRLARERQAGPL